MIGFTWLHWLTFSVLFLSTLSILTFSLFKLRGQVQLVSILVTLIFSIILSYISVIGLDKKTKKVRISKIANKRVLRTEEMIFTGMVTNVGGHTIETVKLEIKLINHGKATGRVKGTDFYKTNSLFDALFSSSSEKRKSRPGSLTYTFVVAKNFEPEENKRFKVRFKFPSYFKDVDYRFKLYNDYADQIVRGF